jgi:hypothetical protein
MSVELKAPPGKVRVVGVDTFDGSDWIEGDFDTRMEAAGRANQRSGEMRKMHVYDDSGQHIYEAGTF